MQPVKSSQIHSVGHDSTSNTLHVKFHTRGCTAKTGECSCAGGPRYSYPNVSAEQHSAFVNAESLGKHFGKHIKGLPFTKEAVSDGN